MAEFVLSSPQSKVVSITPRARRESWYSCRAFIYRVRIHSIEMAMTKKNKLNVFNKWQLRGFHCISSALHTYSVVLFSTGLYVFLVLRFPLLKKIAK